MLLKIDEKLRTLRANSKITQKSLASYLGVSEQAVSRWESGTCYPDIELLPAIASFFSITTDELLGCDKSESEEERILVELDVLLKEGRVDNAISKARSALAVMPDSIPIVILLASNLFALGVSNISTDKEGAVPLLEECIELCKRIMNLKMDSESETTVRLLIVRALCALDRNNEAAGIAGEAPAVYSCREFLVPLTLAGEERLAYMKKAVGTVAQLANSTFIFCRGYGDNGGLQTEPDYRMKEKYLRRSIALYDAMYSALEDDFPKAKYGLFIYGWTYLKLAWVLLQLGEKEASERFLADAVEYVLIADRSEESRLENISVIGGIIDADLHCKGSREDYEGKGGAYVILHGYIENGYFDGLDEAVIEKARRLLKDAVNS